MQLCHMSNNLCSQVIYLYICNFLFLSYFYSHSSYPPTSNFLSPLPSFSPSLSASPPPPSFSSSSSNSPLPPFPYASLSRLVLLLRYSCSVQALVATTLFLQFYLFTLWPSKPLYLVCLWVASAQHSLMILHTAFLRNWGRHPQSPTWKTRLPLSLANRLKPARHSSSTSSQIATGINFRIH